jgi:hypothetical protein
MLEMMGVDNDNVHLGCHACEVARTRQWDQGERRRRSAREVGSSFSKERKAHKFSRSAIHLMLSPRGGESSRSKLPACRNQEKIMLSPWRALPMTVGTR